MSPGAQPYRSANGGRNGEHLINTSRTARVSARVSTTDAFVALIARRKYDTAVTTADITATASVVVAVAAIAVAVWQGMLSREHNRLSVRPHLQITSYLGSPPLRLSIANVGIGPAYIRDVRLRVDGRLVEGDGFEMLANAIGQLGRLKELIATGGLPRQGDVYGAGEREDILIVPDQPLVIDILNRSLHRLRFEIAYTSAYGEEHKLSYSPGQLPLLQPDRRASLD